MLSGKVINAFKSVKNKKDPKNYPACENFPIYEIARMISKKTGYRLNDILDVIDEFTYALAVVIAMRKNVNMHGIKIKQQWIPEEKPSFCSCKDYNSWVYGNFVPILEFDQTIYDLYRGNVAGNEYKGKFDSYFPYIEGKPKTGEEINEIIDNKILEVASLGKDILVDEDGFIKSNSKKKKLYLDWFHPTRTERNRYMYLLYTINKEIREMQKNGATKEECFNYFSNQCKEVIFKDEMIGDLYKKYFDAYKEKGVGFID